MPSRRLWMGIAAFLMLYVGLPLVAALGWGIPLAQKVLTDMIMPVGLVWLGLWGSVIAAWVQRRAARVQLVWIALLIGWTLIGNRVLSGQLLRGYEREFVHQMPHGHYDALIVLGGGVAIDEQGRIYLSGDGQRAVVAVQLFRSGQVDRILATGTRIEGYSRDAEDPKDATAKLLISLGVPDAAIERLPGHNTQAEFAAVRAYLEDPAAPERAQWRVAVVTSAFHMRRALRLAETEGLRVESLPTAFRTAALTPPSPSDLVPQIGAIEGTGLLMKEWLAAWVRH